ncbi:MAG: phospholipase D-like domain-containing protein, partial [Gemmatimonadaceae bacterium]
MTLNTALGTSGQEDDREGRTRVQGTGPVGVPLFSRGLWRIASANVSSGNRVQLLHDGPETFDAMIRLIDEARHSVALESYIFRSDEVGQRFATALKGAAARGVQVRAIMDGIGMLGTSRRYVRDLRQHGVDVRVFTRPGLKLWLGLIPRDHRKLLEVDDRVGITGGLGIGREWMTGV